MRLDTVTRTADQIARDENLPATVRQAARALSRAVAQHNTGLYTPDYTDRRELVEEHGQHVTLNGHPARVSGYLNDSATVMDTTTRLSAEWPWDAVRRVIDEGGAFTT